MRELPYKTDTIRARPLARWHRTFLAELRKAPSVSHACEVARVSRQTAYTHKKTNSAFAAEWRDALDKAIDDLESVAFKLATEGDSSLISFLLRCHRPEIYRDRQEIAVAGGIVFLPQKKEGAE